METKFRMGEVYGVEVIAVTITNEFDSCNSWSAEPVALPRDKDEEAEYLTAYSWTEECGLLFKWDCPYCGAITRQRDFDADLRSFEIERDREIVAEYFPDNLEQQANDIKALDNGECPLCDIWEIES